MNKGNWIGRLTRDPEIRHNTNGTAFGKFTIAVDRPMSKDKTDFIQVSTIQKTAENCAKYLVKGSQVAVQGSIQTGSYTNKNGEKVYTTDVFANSVQFLTKAKEVNTETNMDNETEVLEDIPF